MPTLKPFPGAQHTLEEKAPRSPQELPKGHANGKLENDGFFSLWSFSNTEDGTFSETMCDTF